MADPVLAGLSQSAKAQQLVAPEIEVRRVDATCHPIALEGCAGKILGASSRHPAANGSADNWEERPEEGSNKPPLIGYDGEGGCKGKAPEVVANVNGDHLVDEVRVTLCCNLQRELRHTCKTGVTAVIHVKISCIM